MENFQGNYSRATKIKVPPGMKTLKLKIGSDRYQGSSISAASYDSENVDLNAPILRYLCGGSPIAGKVAPRGSRLPLSAVENLIERSPPPLPPEVYRTPVKAVEGEEVLVMDAVPLKRSSRFSGSESSGSSGKSLFKAEIFPSPEDSGKCRYSSKCQFTRGKEDDRPSRPSTKNKTEPQQSDTHDNSSGLGTHSPNSVVLPDIAEPTSTEATMRPFQIHNRPLKGNPNQMRPPPPPPPPRFLVAMPGPPPPPFYQAQMPFQANYVMPENMVPFIPGQTPPPSTPTSSNHQMSADATPFIPRLGNIPPLPMPPAGMTFVPPPMPQFQIASPNRPVTPVGITLPPRPPTPARMPLPPRPPTPVRMTSPAPSNTPTPAASPAIPVTPTTTPSSSEPVTPVRKASPATSVTPTLPASSITGSQNSESTPTTYTTRTDWSPQDDGIEVTLPFSSPGEPPSRDSVNSHIDSVLSGRGRSRLPAFSEFCSDK